MSASALRTLWTVAKPKTQMVAVRWRERWRSVPNLSLAVPNPKVVLRALVPNQKSTILKLGPRPTHPGIPSLVPFPVANLLRFTYFPHFPRGVKKRRAARGPNLRIVLFW